MKKNKELIKINIIRHTGMYFFLFLLFLIIFIWFSSETIIYFKKFSSTDTPYEWNLLWLMAIFCLWIGIYYFVKALLLIKKNFSIYSHKLVFWTVKNKSSLMILFLFLIGIWFWILLQIFSYDISSFLYPNVLIFIFAMFSFLLSFCLLILLWYQLKIKKIKLLFQTQEIEKLKPPKTAELTNVLSRRSYISKWIYLNGFYLSLVLFIIFLLSLIIKAFLDKNLSVSTYGRLNFSGILSLVILSVLLCFLFIQIIYSTRQLHLSKTRNQQAINLDKKIAKQKIWLWTFVITLWLGIATLLLFFLLVDRYWLNIEERENWTFYNFPYRLFLFWVIFNLCFFGAFAVFWTFCLIFLFLRKSKIKKEIKLSLSREEKFTKFNRKNKSVSSLYHNH